MAWQRHCYIKQLGSGLCHGQLDSHRQDAGQSRKPQVPAESLRSTAMDQGNLIGTSAWHGICTCPCCSRPACAGACRGRGCMHCTEILHFDNAAEGDTPRDALPVTSPAGLAVSARLLSQACPYSRPQRLQRDTVCATHTRPLPCRRTGPVCVCCNNLLSCRRAGLFNPCCKVLGLSGCAADALLSCRRTGLFKPCCKRTGPVCVRCRCSSANVLICSWPQRCFISAVVSGGLCQGLPRPKSCSVAAGLVT